MVCGQLDEILYSGYSGLVCPGEAPRRQCFENNERRRRTATSSSVKMILIPRHYEVNKQRNACVSHRVQVTTVGKRTGKIPTANSCSTLSIQDDIDTIVIKLFSLEDTNTRYSQTANGLLSFIIMNYDNNVSDNNSQRQQFFCHRDDHGR